MTCAKINCSWHQRLRLTYLPTYVGRQAGSCFITEVDMKKSWNKKSSGLKRLNSNLGQFSRNRMFKINVVELYYYYYHQPTLTRIFENNSRTIYSSKSGTKLGYFWKGLGNKVPYKRSPNFGHILGYFIKCHFYVKTVWANLREKLVTLYGNHWWHCKWTYHIHSIKLNT